MDFEFMDEFKADDLSFLNKCAERYTTRYFVVRSNVLIDVSLESGKNNITKELIKKYNCKPSLYSVQIAIINGFENLAYWVLENAELRNHTGIWTIHYDYKYGWNAVIPHAYRYDLREIHNEQMNEKFRNNECMMCEDLVDAMRDNNGPLVNYLISTLNCKPRICDIISMHKNGNHKLAFFIEEFSFK